jgi:ubiquinone/menaquinone biosynthesis C-methylase UbiE
MSLWRRVVAATYDGALAPSERNGLGALRSELLAAARGRVVELGAGTGANLDHWPRGPVTSLLLTEPDPHMARRLERHVARREAAARVVRAPAAELPVEDASADTVVASLVLCTVPDVAAALAEVRRVLAPGGRLLFLEHVRHRDPARARRQDRLTPVHRALAAGCHPNRPTPDLIAAAGFTVRDQRVEHFPKAARYLQPLVLGSATA